MEKTLAVLNRMVADKVISNYAIGGAVAATFYLEPFATIDLDIFVQVTTEGSELMILAPIYNYLTIRGYVTEAEYINIEDFPVQFLPVFNPLTDEAVTEAKTVRYGQQTTRVMRPEHLVAIMLDTGRAKDYLRIGAFLDQDAVDLASLRIVLTRHNLLRKWRDNKGRFEP